MSIIDEASAAPEKGLPSFAALRAFEALVRLGSMRKAAESLGIHRSVVSRHLAHLEAWLGVSLLQWSGNRFTLSEDGRRYYGRIASAIAEITQATNELLGEEADRSLRIWCSPGLSIEWMASQIAEFEKHHPDIHIDLKPSDTPANLQAYEADINIFMQLDGPTNQEVKNGLKTQVLARPIAMIAASPTLALQLAWITSVNDLLDVPLLHGRHTNDWRFWLASHGVDVPDQLPGELCWHPHMALEAARLGRGVLLGNRFFFERDLERGDLVELKIPGATNRPFGGYVFVAREDRWSMPRIAAVRQFLTERMRMMEEI